MNDSTFQVIALPNPFDITGRVRADCTAGATIADVLGPRASHSLAVTLDGYPVARELWARVRPKAGHMMHVTSFPQGGNGGKWLRTILLVVVAVVAVWITAGGAAPFVAALGGNAAIVGAAVGMIGTMEGRALTPEGTP